MRKPTKHSLKVKADKLFSQWIRSRGFCEWCGKKDDTLQCCHIFSRRYLVTRWDEHNALCLCAGCHMKGHAQPIEFVELVKEQLGAENYDNLRLRAKTCVDKVDLNEIITNYTKLLEE